MLTEVEKRTIEVCTVKVALVAPAGTVTLEVTLATAVLLLGSVTLSRPAGARPLSVTAPVQSCDPPPTPVGFRLSDERCADAEKVTVRLAVLVTPPEDAERVTGVETSTTAVVTVKVALMAPA